MQRHVVVWLVIALARTAAAQAPGQIEPVAAPFLEKRVPEELATEGVVLSRRNLALQIEQLGDKWLVSLVNLTTGRVSASTKLDALPADREAAVAAMTHIVADLAEQVVGRAEPPPPPPSPSPPPPAAVGDEDRPERSAGELDYKRQSIHFGERYLIMGSPSSVTMERTWVAFKGELDLELQPLAFYAAVGRPDLGAKYTARRDIMFGSYVVMALGYTVGLGLIAAHHASDDHCDRNLGPCHDPAVVGPLIAIGIGTIGLGVGVWYQFHPHPIDENAAKSLADAYNQGLRRQLGLPVASRRPLLRGVRLAPYVAAHQGGLGLSARF